ncbi:uncharacterized protein IL334_000352 [Kwoniella shivajii]|uniref:Uncharacterized protein n=1 Tax=Kwoniella shivajii TaxID=564305 RepID=A0ABZ1CT48_9TREE|nr:hypothetical protein IL334_000352 [Kwoniella shivajii]
MDPNPAPNRVPNQDPLTFSGQVISYRAPVELEIRKDEDNVWGDGREEWVVQDIEGLDGESFPSALSAWKGQELPSHYYDSESLDPFQLYNVPAAKDGSNASTFSFGGASLQPSTILTKRYDLDWDESAPPINTFSRHVTLFVPTRSNSNVHDVYSGTASVQPDLQHLGGDGYATRGEICVAAPKRFDPVQTISVTTGTVRGETSFNDKGEGAYVEILPSDYKHWLALVASTRVPLTVNGTLTVFESMPDSTTYV